MMLSDEFEFVKGFPKKSASRTDFWKIRRKTDGEEFAIKVFVESEDGVQPKQYALLKHEVRTYKLLKKHLIDAENVRNIIPIYAIGTITFNDIVQLIMSSPNNNLTRFQISQNLLQNTKYMTRASNKRIVIDMTPNHDTEFRTADIERFHYAYMVTPYLNCSDFIKFLTKTKNLSTRQLCRYMAVICTTIYQMSAIGVNENDLHLGNILMSDQVFGPTKYHSQIYLLVFNKTTYIIDNPYTPYVYDFDRAAIDGKYISQLEYAVKGGNCTTYHEKRDFIRLLCGLYKWIPYMRSYDDMLVELQDAILHVLIKDKRLQSAVKYADPACWLTHKNSSVQCDDKLLLEGMASTESILRFFFNNSDFKTVPTKKLYENHKESLTFIHKNFCMKNHWKIRDKTDVQRYVTTNIQFVGKFNTSEKYKIIHNITQKCVSKVYGLTTQP